MTSEINALLVTPSEADTATLASIPAPTPSGDQLLIETLEVGVCGTDRTIVAGKYGTPPPGQDQLVLGHEVVGRVKTAGGGFDQGDLVAATVRRPCGACANCAAGEVDACSTGRFTERGIVGLDGFARELFAESPRNLIRIPSSLGRLGVLGEPMSIAERGWRHTQYVGHRQGWEPRRAIVLGIGAIGVLSVALLRLAGVETWAYARRSSETERAELIRRTGAEYISAEELGLSALAEQIGGPDLILEAAGSAELAVQAIRALGPNGVLCLRGISPRSDQLSIPADLLTGETVIKNKAIIGSTNAAPVDWQQGIEDLARIRQQWRDLLDRVVGLSVEPEDFAEALAYPGVKATIRFA
jgi:threonine dehydrogenase-like Zn-dependent dehydrogenase